MKRMLKAAALTCLLLCALCSAALAQFDLSEFEFEGEYKDMYSISHENDNVFIDAGLSAKEKSFSHEHESKEYYSTLEADLIVLYPGQSQEYVVPRLWICCCSDGKPFGIRTAEFTIGDTAYTYEPENIGTTYPGNGSAKEELLIKFGRDSLEMLRAWFQAATDDEIIRVRLRGESAEIEFDMPDLVMDSAGLMWRLYENAGGTESIDRVKSTPVSVAPAKKLRKKNVSGVLQYQDKLNNATFSIPMGWAMTADGSKDEGAIRFEWNDTESKESARIVYVSSDVWTDLLQENPELAQGVERSSLDEIFDRESVAETYDVDMSSVQEVKIGNYEYFRVEKLRTEKPVAYADIFYLSFLNGYSYLFSYTGSPTKLDDLEEILQSVEHFRSM